MIIPCNHHFFKSILPDSQNIFQDSKVFSASNNCQTMNLQGISQVFPNICSHAMCHTLGATISEALPPLLPKTLATAMGAIGDAGSAVASALAEAVEAQKNRGQQLFQWDFNRILLGV